MSTPAASSVRITGDWLSFQIGTQLYAAPLADVNEVTREGDITPVPGSADDILGVRHLRGRIVPVLDGRRRLAACRTYGIESDLQPILHKSDRLLDVRPPMADPAQVRLVVLAPAGQLVGLRVDAVGELLCSDGIEIEPPAERAGGSDDPVTGMLCWRGGFVALLDVCRLCRLSGEDAHVA